MGAAINATWYDSQNSGSPWNWSSWYNSIVRPSFCDSEYSVYSSLCIDNYQNSLYMQTVQGYIQGLEQGSITKNCTFIPITAYPISVAGPNADGSFNYTRTITYQALDGTNCTITETYRTLPNLKYSEIILRVAKPGVQIEYVIGLTSSSAQLVVWYGKYIAMLPAFGPISVTVDLITLGYDVAKGDWQMVILDIATMAIDTAGVNFGVMNSLCLYFGWSSINAIYLMAFSAAVISGILAGLFFYNLALLCGADVGTARIIGIIAGIAVGAIAFYLILILFVL